MTLLSNKPKKYHLGFENFTTNLWKAGEVYEKNLFSALKEFNYENEIEISLFSNNNIDGVSSLLLPYIDHVYTIPVLQPIQVQKQTITRRFVNAFNSRILKRKPEIVPDVRMSDFFRNQAIDVYFSQAIYGPHFNIPNLCWIPDFQSFYYPEMFSQDQLSERLTHYEKVINFADRIILSGESARSDFEVRYPSASSKLRVLSFVASVPKSIYNINPFDMCLKYNLPEKFFYLPNQIWKHKNHKIVLESLNIIKNDCPDVKIVVSGMPFDGRHPTHFAELLSMISTFGIRDQIIFLGIVPYNDVLALIRQSIAVIQPSLFEGWSTTVEEVKSLGKSIILSDIPVHRDQNPPYSTFFNPYDKNELADILKKYFFEKKAGPDYLLESQAQKVLQLRLKNFGLSFLKIVQELV